MNKLLREVIVPPNQFKLPSQEIDTKIIVFDGGNSTSPPIKPPDGILWRSISVHLLHAEDVTLPCIIIEGNLFVDWPQCHDTWMRYFHLFYK